MLSAGQPLTAAPWLRHIDRPIRSVACGGIVGRFRTHIPTGRHCGDMPHPAAVSVSPILPAFVGADPPVSKTSNPLEIQHSQTAGKDLAMS
jgi:hypothetical protein